jgi:hypothetical protein
MDLVQAKGSLQKHDKVYGAMLKITLKIKERPQFEVLKLNHDLTSYVCCWVETLISKKLDIDKKQIAIQILTDVYSLTPDEQAQISKQIEFLKSVGLIKKLSIIKRIGWNVSNFFLKNFTI